MNMFPVRHNMDVVHIESIQVRRVDLFEVINVICSFVVAPKFWDKFKIHGKFSVILKR